MPNAHVHWRLCLVFGAILFAETSRAGDRPSDQVPETSPEEIPAGEQSPPRPMPFQTPDFLEVSPTPGFYVPLATPLSIRLLDNELVRKELKRSVEQINHLGQLHAEQSKAAAKVEFGLIAFGQNLEPTDNNALNKSILAELTLEQRNRLDQMVYQHIEKQFGRAGVLQLVAGELKLNDYQRERFDVLRIKHVDVILDRLAADDDPTMNFRRLSEANQEYIAETEHLLTAEQRQQLQRLRGEPVRMEIWIENPPSRYRIAAGDGRAMYLQNLWEEYGYELEFLDSDPIAKEIDLTWKQWKLVGDQCIQWRKSVRANRLQGKSLIDSLKSSKPIVAKAIDELLPQQAIRFREIMLQHRIELGGLGAACGYPGVAKELGIYSSKKWLKNGVHPYNVLEYGQITDLQKLIGKPFEGTVAFDYARLADFVALDTVKSPYLPVDQPALPEYIVHHDKTLHLQPWQRNAFRSIAANYRVAMEALHNENVFLSDKFANRALFQGILERQSKKELDSLTLDASLNVLDKQQRIEFKAELLERYMSSRQRKN